jgi:large subunit ribosomal protein L10
MAMTRARKVEHVEQVRATFDRANTLYLVDLCGLSVNEVNRLRTAVREVGGGMNVVRNRLAKLALEGDELETLREHLSGPTALVHHPREPVGMAKVLARFAKEHPALEIKAGFVERRQVVDEAGVKSIAELPGLEETRAMLLGVLSAPASKLVRLLATPGTQMARVIDARSEAQS